MIVDTSVLVAIAKREYGHEDVLAAMRSVRSLSLSAASFVELSIVLRDRMSVDDLQGALDDLGIETTPVDVAQALTAAGAYRRYGRGSGHPARLNYGDTLPYALAVTTGQRLLYVGDDFTHTDIV